MIAYRCPVTGEALAPVAPAGLAGPSGHTTYPVVDGIPVLLAGEADRARAVSIQAGAPDGCGSPGTDAPDALDFYNQTRHHHLYCRPELPDVRADIVRCHDDFSRAGPALEIGSGMGSLQGLFPEYLALDYSLTALAAYIDPAWPRVCASAEQLPFFDGTFAFLYTVATLEHVPDPGLAFEEIDRVLMPGGVAFVLPAWHAVQYNCEGIPVRPYTDLALGQKWVKLTLPVRRLPVVKAATALPGRVLRRATWAMRPAPTRLAFVPLEPEYSAFWLSDSDACARLDSHEGSLFFHSRGYDVLSPGPRAVDHLLARHVPVVVRKPHP